MTLKLVYENSELLDYDYDAAMLLKKKHIKSLRWSWRVTWPKRMHMPMNIQLRARERDRERERQTDKEFTIDFTFYKVLIIMLFLWQSCAVFSSTLSSDSWSMPTVKQIWRKKHCWIIVTSVFFKHLKALWPSQITVNIGHYIWARNYW